MKFFCGLMQRAVAMSDEVECPVNKYTITTKAKVMKIDYEWTIPDFANEISSDDCKIIQGPTIYASGTNVRWQLRMVTSRNGYLVVSIRQLTYGERERKIQGYLIACIVDANNSKVFHNGFTKVPDVFVTVGNIYRWEWELIKKEDLLNNLPRFLLDGKLTVLCAVHYLRPRTKTYVSDEPEIVSCMRNVLAKGLFSDVTVVADVSEFPAHRAVLAEHSDVFRAMFEVDMVEKHDNRVVIEDISADALNDFLTYIYTDSAPNISVNALELLAAAEKYNIVPLKTACETELAKSLNIDNVVDILIESETHRACLLKDDALEFIRKNAPDVTKTTAWRSLCEQHPKLSTEVCNEFAMYIEELKQLLKRK